MKRDEKIDIKITKKWRSNDGETMIEKFVAQNIQILKKKDNGVTSK